MQINPIDDIYWFDCVECVACGPCGDSREEAIHLWNEAPRQSDNVNQEIEIAKLKNELAARKTALALDPVAEMVQESDNDMA
jgi:hypothetical protein